MTIQDNLARIRTHIPHQTIVAATKYVGPAEMRELFAQGIVNMGENHAQALLEKQEELNDLPIKWHFIGHLQTNKVKAVINRIECLHSLDSLRLAAEITKYRFTPLDCFIEVHISSESTKTGIMPLDLPNFIDSLAKYDTIRVIGLMGMAENTEDDRRIRADFMALAQLQKEIESRHLSYAPCHDLSMGMSHDYQIAIECGATYVRLGSILFRKEE